jgi:tetratricopeptide (TPR) repeat protein
LKDGVPDPTFLAADRRSLATLAMDAIKSWHERKVSPVYHLLPKLKEPDWKELRVEEATEFWATQQDWERRIQVARRLGRPGDIMVLADEAPSRAMRMETCRTAARTLQSLGQYQLALEQCERALELEPHDLENRTLKGLLLNRLKLYDQAREWIEAVVRDYPNDAEAWGLLGRVQKEAWIATWRKESSTLESRRAEAASAQGLLRQSFEAYANGFLQNPSEFYTGINAVTSLHLLKNLRGEDGLDARRQVMEGGVHWAALSKMENDPNDYWARATLAELLVLSGDIKSIKRSYQNAIAIARAQNNWFALDSSRQQLLLLRDLGFRPDDVASGLALLEAALEGLAKPEALGKPQRVILFSGHMIDKPDRPTPRFPASKEPVAAKEIERTLDELNASAGDLALCGGACGGDLLFAEACLRRGLRLELRLPFDEPEFLRQSVTFAGDQWRERFYNVKAHANTKVLVMPQELGPSPTRISPYARANLWQLYSAMAWGDEKLRFVCLWDGRGGDGPGGTQHMFEVARSRTDRVYHIDTTKVFWPPS